jgi:hypothetical protein
MPLVFAIADNKSFGPLRSLGVWGYKFTLAEYGINSVSFVEHGVLYVLLEFWPDSCLTLCSWLSLDLPVASSDLLTEGFDCYRNAQYMGGRHLLCVCNKSLLLQ